MRHGIMEKEKDVVDKAVEDFFASGFELMTKGMKQLGKLVNGMLQ
jgi:hypothetical protein